VKITFGTLFDYLVEPLALLKRVSHVEGIADERATRVENGSFSMSKKLKAVSDVTNSHLQRYLKLTAPVQQICQDVAIMLQQHSTD